MRHWWLALACATLVPAPALALCIREGNTITCTGATRGSIASLTPTLVTVNTGATLVNIPRIDTAGDCSESISTISLGPGSALRNAGTVSGFGVCTPAVQLDRNSSATNTGSINAFDDAGVGILIDSRTTVFSSGSIATRGAAGVAIFGGDLNEITLTSTSLIETTGSIASGIGLTGGATIFNAGTIRTSGLAAPAIETIDNFVDPRTTSTRVVNTGLVEALGPRTIAVRIDADTVEFINSGIVRATFRDASRVFDFSRAANISGDVVTVSNSGTMTGAVGGMEMLATRQLSFTNSGSIVAQAGIGRAVDMAAPALSFVNTGFISGRLSGVRIRTATAFEFANSGTIETNGGGAGELLAPAVAIGTDTAVPVFFSNSGRISAAANGTAIQLDSGNDTVFNAGELRGVVSLGGGNDAMFIQRGGTLSGVLDGGLGLDRLVLLDSGTLNWTLRNMEELVVLASDRWTQTTNVSVDRQFAVVQGEYRVSPNTILSAPSIQVTSGANLSGTGQLRGTLTIAGTISPGPGGNLAVDGDLTVQPTGRLLFDLGANGVSGLLNVNGRAVLDGAITVARAPGLRYRGGERFVLVSTTNGVAGTGVRSTTALNTFVNAVIAPTDDGRQVTFAINRTPYATVAPDRPSQRAAAALDSALATARPGLNTLFDQFDMMAIADVAVAVTELSPQLPTAIRPTLIAGGQDMLDALAAQTRPRVTGSYAWASATGRQGKTTRRESAYDFRSRTLAAGMTGELAEQSTWNVGLGQTRAHVTPTSSIGNATLETTYVFASAATALRAFDISGSLMWGDVDTSWQRTSSKLTGPLAASTQAQGSGHQWGLHVSADMPRAYRSVTVSPHIGFQAWRTVIDAVTETGPLAIEIAAQRAWTARPTIGLRVDHDSDMGPYAQMNASYELSHSSNGPVAAFRADRLAQFALRENPQRRLWVTTQLGVRNRVGAAGYWYMRFDGNLTDSTQGRSISAGLAWAW
jgi:hypothetical protein